MEDGVGSDELGFAPQFDWLRDYCIAIMVVEYHGVLASTTGGHGEADSLVRGDFTSQFDCIIKKLGGIVLGDHAGLEGQ